MFFGPNYNEVRVREQRKIFRSNSGEIFLQRFRPAIVLKNIKSILCPADTISFRSRYLGNLIGPIPRNTFSRQTDSSSSTITMRGSALLVPISSSAPPIYGLYGWTLLKVKSAAYWTLVQCLGAWMESGRGVKLKGWGFYPDSKQRWIPVNRWKQGGERGLLWLY